MSAIRNCCTSASRITFKISTGSRNSVINSYILSVVFPKFNNMFVREFLNDSHRKFLKELFQQSLQEFLKKIRWVFTSS